MKRLTIGVIAWIGVIGAAEACQPAERVVFAGGDLTEIAYALGAESRIVGVDSTSIHPASATGKAQIGYVRNLSAEGVLSLAPDLVIAAYDAGPPAALTQIEAAGLKVVLAPEGHSAAGVPEKVRFVGGALCLAERAATLADQVAADLKAATDSVAAQPTRPKVLFVLAYQEEAPLVGGAETSADAIIRLAGGVNAASGFSGYKIMSREAIIEAAPDYLLMMASTAGRLGGIGTVLQRPEIALTPAGHAGRGITMDGMTLLGFGIRTPEAVSELGEALHGRN